MGRGVLLLSGSLSAQNGGAQKCLLKQPPLTCLHFFLYISRAPRAHWGPRAQRVWAWIPQWLPPGSPQSDGWGAHLPRGHAQALDGLQSVIPGRTGEGPQSGPWYVGARGHHVPRLGVQLLG